jgi:cobalt-zinc-cadmium resistance protein CzcA
MAVAEAVFRGAEQRMRPLLMTALSAAVGLFPAAISHGIGSQVQRPLATVVVGGMTIGPLMSLIVAPALRLLFLRGEDRAGQNGDEFARLQGHDEVDDI